MFIEMSISRVLMRETEDTHIVELEEVGGGRVFSIVIGLFEAAAIQRRLLGQAPPRPQTHELLADIISQLGGRVERIEVVSLREGTFYCCLKIRQGDRVLEIDCRPSDAVAVGVSEEVPIYVEEGILAVVGMD